MLPPMPRPKSIPDAEVLRTARQLYAGGGSRALSFGTLARATGLAASTLAQRYGTVEGLQAAAARDGWAELMALADQAAADSGGKGPQGFLKALERGFAGGAGQIPRLVELGAFDEGLAALAAEWRIRVETELAARLGQGERVRSAAQALFTLWQGQLLWRGSGEEIRLKDVARRLL